MNAKIMWYHLNGACGKLNSEALGIHEGYGQNDVVRLTAINHPDYDWSDGKYLFKDKWVRRDEESDN